MTSRTQDDRGTHAPLGLLLGVSLQRQAVLFRQLATMIDSGLTSGRAIEALAKQTTGHFGDALRQIGARLVEGSSLHASLAAYPEYFSEYVVCLVQAGETGGQLDVRLREIADSLEQSYEIRQKLVSQATYPLVVLHLAVFLPPLFLLFTQSPAAYLGAVLPKLAIMYGLAGLWLLARRVVALATPMRTMVDTVLIHLPIVGPVVRDGALVRGLGAMGDLLEAGISSVVAVRIASRTCGQAVVGARLAATEEGLDKGLSFSAALAQTGIVPPAAMQMVVTGELSGTIGASLNKASDLMRVDFDNAVRRLAAVAPALMTLAVGGLVGSQIVSMYRAQMQTLNGILP